jgi:hypothetical protein
MINVMYLHVKESVCHVVQTSEDLKERKQNYLEYISQN